MISAFFKSAIILLLFLFSTTGCVVRSYSVHKDRLDQSMETGNRGFMAGAAGPVDPDRPKTRETKVVEIEVRPLFRSKPRVKPPEPVAVSSQGPVETAEPFAGPEGKTVTVMEDYRVQDGDTLQKISRKFYGSIKYWQKIYDANKDALKKPDRIFPGQLIKVPRQMPRQAGEVGAAAPSNLK